MRAEPRVLVIEDHPKVANGIQRGLEQHGCRVTTASTGEDGWKALQSNVFDIVILDLMLPGRSGLDVLASLRSEGHGTPVLVLTAKDSLDDRLCGLDGGADDYMVKPFALPELLARVRALLRRASRQMVHRLQIADLELNLITRQAHRGGRALDLAPREFELLAYLVSHAETVVSREMLGRHVWAQIARGTPLDNVIDVHIGRLRRKVDADERAALIHTVRGLGFMVSVGRPR